MWFWISWLGLFSMSELLFGDRLKRSLIYRHCTTRTTRPWYHVTCVRSHFSIIFGDFFTMHPIKKKLKMAENSRLIFLKRYHIALYKMLRWSTLKDATILKWPQTDPTQLKIHLLPLQMTTDKKNKFFFVYFHEINR